MNWVRANAPGLSRKPSAFVSVCLGVLQNDPKVRRDLGAIQDRFAEWTGWRPARVKEVAGALKYTRYWWLKRMAMRYIAGRAGGSTDTSRDHEYTDWEDLKRFAKTFFDGMTE